VPIINAVSNVAFGSRVRGDLEIAPNAAECAGTPNAERVSESGRKRGTRLCAVWPLGRNGGKKSKSTSKPQQKQQQQPIIINNVSAPAPMPVSDQILASQSTRRSGWQPLQAPFAAGSLDMPYMPPTTQVQGDVHVSAVNSSFGAATTNRARAFNNVRDVLHDEIQEEAQAVRATQSPQEASPYLDQLNTFATNLSSLYDNHASQLRQAANNGTPPPPSPPLTSLPTNLVPNITVNPVIIFTPSVSNRNQQPYYQQPRTPATATSTAHRLLNLLNHFHHQWIHRLLRLPRLLVVILHHLQVMLQ
jgi:hypothetical protein